MLTVEYSDHLGHRMIRHFDNAEDLTQALRLQVTKSRIARRTKQLSKERVTEMLSEENRLLSIIDQYRRSRNTISGAETPEKFQ